MPRGETLNKQSRKMLYDVYKFMAKEAEEGVKDLKAVQKRTAAATQTSLITVKRIVKEANSSELPSVFRTPGKRRPRPKTVTNVDDFNKDVIKRCIHNFNITNKPTIKKIQQKLHDDIGLQVSSTSLRRIIKELGFRWSKTKNNGKILIEKSDILKTKKIEEIYVENDHIDDLTDQKMIKTLGNSSDNDSDMEESSTEDVQEPTTSGAARLGASGGHGVETNLPSVSFTGDDSD